MSGEETLSQAPSQPPPPTSGLPNQLGAGPHAREPLQAGEVPIRPPARSRSAAGRFPTPQGPAPNVRHPPLRGAEAPASQPAPSHRALTCAGPRVRLRLWAAGLNPLSLGARSTEFHLGWALSRPRRPGRRPRPGPAKPCSYWLMFPPLTFGPALGPAPGTARGPSCGEPPRLESSVGARTLPRSLGAKRLRLRQASGRHGCRPAEASRQSSLVVTVPAVQQAPRRWTRTLHNVDSSQLPVRQSLIKKFKWHLTQGNSTTVSCQRL